jgi:hypothetical protein
MAEQTPAQIIRASGWAGFCRSQGIFRGSGPDGRFVGADVDAAMAVWSIRASAAHVERVLAAAEQAEVDEFAHLFPPTGSQPVEASADDEDDDEFAPYFPPTGSAWG